eukprot:375668-Amorphochlora_amoeboformis.AAC.1
MDLTPRHTTDSSSHEHRRSGFFHPCSPPRSAFFKYFFRFSEEPSGERGGGMLYKSFTVCKANKFRIEGRFTVDKVIGS